MGKLYDYATRIQEHIEKNNLDVFKSRGQLAMRCGFIITLVKPEDPDDAEKLQALRNAAMEVFGIRLD
ncbi:MAG: hypothetical protein Q7W30_00105 [Coriobacteriia bacterium]|nr:hypothetical protein [Coriobacteriia bacterium]